MGAKSLDNTLFHHSPTTLSPPSTSRSHRDGFRGTPCTPMSQNGSASNLTSTATVRPVNGVSASLSHIPPARLSLPLPPTSSLPFLFTPPTTPPPAITPPQQHSRRPQIVECKVRARIPTFDGSEFFLHLYQNDHDGKEHLAIVYGDDIRSTSLDAPKEGETEMDRIIRGGYRGRLKPGAIPQSNGCEVVKDVVTNGVGLASTAPLPPPLVRIHSECFTGENVHSARCDCGEQLDEAMRLIQREGRGVVVYLRQEGRGIGLLDKLKAYNLQDLGYDTVSANLMLHHPPDARSYTLATAILRDLGLSSIRLLTNNPDKIEQIEADGVRVVERVAMVPKAWEEGKRDTQELDKYLKVKVTRMRHLIDLPSSLMSDA